LLAKEIVAVLVMKACERSGGAAPLILNLGTRKTESPAAALSGWKKPAIPSE
jgi:hypothetical protein